MELSRSPPQEGRAEDVSHPAQVSSPRLRRRPEQPPSSPQSVPGERPLLPQSPAGPCGAESPGKFMFLQLELLCSSYTFPTRLLKS